MTGLLLTFGSSSSSSSIVLPPNSIPFPPHHSTGLKPSLPAKHSPPNLPSSSSTTTPPRHLPWSRHNLLNYYADLPEDGRFTHFLTIAFVCLGITRMIKEGKLQNVVEILSGAKKLGWISMLKLFDGFAMEALAVECRRRVDSGELEDVVGLMESFAGFGFSIKELVKPYEIIKICVNQRNPNLAGRYARIFPHAQILFCTIIMEFGKRGDLASALTVFEVSRQKNDCPNMYAYRTIIDVCGLCGDYLKSRSIYEELLVQNVTPSIYVINSLMNVNAHDLSYTLRVYKQMRNLGIIVDIASYNILLKSCRLAARVDLAEDIYKEVQRLQSIGALKLDVFTYSTIIKVFSDAKLWQMALGIKEDMLSAGVIPNTVTWSSLISSCANAGLVEKSIQLFEEMLLSGCKPNSQCCNILLHACVEACQYDRAFRLFRSWNLRGFQKAFDDRDSSVEHGRRNYTSSIEKPTYDSHRLSFTTWVHFAPTTSTYNILMKACGSDYYRAKALMDEMKRVGLSPNIISWSILMDICGDSGRVQGALKILKSMRDAGIQPDVVAYTAAIKVCVERRNLKFAFSLYEEMRRYQIQPNLVTYSTLLRARSRYGSLQEVQQCLAIYQDMRKAGVSSNSKSALTKLPDSLNTDILLKNLSQSRLAVTRKVLARMCPTQMLQGTLKNPTKSYRHQSSHRAQTKGYKSNDYYLKQLIEEWCEGVMQDNGQNQGLFSSSNRNDLGGTQSLLLEKVAAHLQKGAAESLVIDLRRLTKVEARIVVLAVLRMIKENYTAGDSIEDDMLIIIGVEERGAAVARCESGVKDAMIKLLRDNLVLEVLLPRPRTAIVSKTNLENPFHSHPNLEEEIIGKNRFPTQLESRTRRPAVLDRLRVTKESLHRWVRRRSNAGERINMNIVLSTEAMSLTEIPSAQPNVWKL